MGGHTHSKALFVIIEVSLLHGLVNLTDYCPDHLVATVLTIITVTCIISSDMQTFSYHRHVSISFYSTSVCIPIVAHHFLSCIESTFNVNFAVAA